MGRLRAIKEQNQRAQPAEEDGVDWGDLCKRIDEGQVIPIIGNGVFNDLLFPMTEEDLREIKGRQNPLGWSVEEQLTDLWADAIEYPLMESHVLPRVALFDRVINSKDNQEAKENYLNWLKGSFLTLAALDTGRDADQVADLRAELKRQTLSYLAGEMGYPKPGDDGAHTLDLLARLNLPIYITTSPFDLLERAIAANGRPDVRTQICFWRGAEPLRWVNEAHRTDYAFMPSAETPLVYHMFGLEAYPDSMVLSEDDYLDFLTAIARDTDQTKPILPLYLRQAITRSSLLLMGYRLRDADFRVLFRGLINATPTSIRPYSLAIQVDPRQHAAGISTDKLLRYLKIYFGESKFTIAWNQPHEFARILWKKFDEWRR